MMHTKPMHARPYRTLGIMAFLSFVSMYALMYAPKGEGCSLVVHIDYAHPESLPERWLGRLLGAAYARWCVRRMTTEARVSDRADR